MPPGQVTPTVVVPRRPAGLAALELDDTDLGGITLLQPSVQGVLPHDRTAVTEGLTLLDDGQASGEHRLLRALIEAGDRP